MARERKWKKVPPQPIIANGTSSGQIQVDDTTLFKVKQVVLIKSNTIQGSQYKIQRINDINNMELAELSAKNIDDRADLSSVHTSDNPTIQTDWQDRPTISWEDIRRAVYEEEPTVALRTIWVDQLGVPFNKNNPIPIVFDGTISVGKVQVEGTNGNTIEPNADGSINAVIVSGEGSKPTVAIFNQVASIPTSVETSILAFTVPPGKQYLIEEITGSGENIAKFNVYIGTTLIDVKRTYYATDFNVKFDYRSQGKGILLSEGDILTLKVIQDNTDLGDFDGRFQLVELM